MKKVHHENCIKFHESIGSLFVNALSALIDVNGSV